MESKTIPFVYGRIAAGNDFTDREAESQHLRQNFSGGINTILISPRRWGKSSLVYRTARQMQKQKQQDIVFCFIDLFNVRTEQDFYELFARELIRISASKWEERIAQGKKFFRKLIPRFSVGLDPNSEFAVSLDWKEVEKAPEEILNLAENICKAKKIKVVVCIDEFQNIAYFDDHLAFQKKLRAHWQHHQLASYCLFGSKRHLLMHLFNDPSMPFYKFGDMIFLQKIETSFWVSFIVKRFRDTGKQIDEKQALRIATLMENHPYFVQQMAQTVWQHSGKKCTATHIDQALDRLLLQHSILFQREIDQLTNTQVNFLKALCNGVTQFSAKENLDAYQLGTSANVNRIKDALENKEIIDLMGGRIEFIDPLFKHWLVNIYLRK
jgi:hypothetical protein